MDRFSLDGKVAIITGASKGIGRALAIGFADAGAKVIVSSRTLEACQAVVTEIDAAGGEALAVACDIGDLDTHAALIDLRCGAAERALARAREARPIAELLERPSETWLALALQIRAARELGERDCEDDGWRALAAGNWQMVAAPLRQRSAELLGKEAT